LGRRHPLGDDREPVHGRLPKRPILHRDQESDIEQLVDAASRAISILPAVEGGAGHGFRA
jgi:hypothetical protein